MEENKEIHNHDVTMTSRKRLEMTGINDVTSFDEGQIVARNSNSDISIDGEELKIERFDSESGDLVVKGRINGLNYYNDTSQKKKKSVMNIFK